MKGTLAAMIVLTLALSAAAQSPAPPASSAAASASAATPSSQAASLPASSPAQSAAPAKPADLATTLTDAEAAITALNTDIAGLPVEKSPAGWKTGWLKKGSHKQSAQVAQAAETLKPHAAALPEMIAEVRTAHGSVGSAFRLFNNLTTVCGEMDALVEAMQNSGKKEDAARLAADYSSLQRVRANISAYVEQRAAIVDPKGNVPPPVTASAAKPATKKDESSPAKKTVAKAKKKPAHKTVAAN